MAVQQKVLVTTSIGFPPEDQVNEKLEKLGSDWKIVSVKTNLLLGKKDRETGFCVRYFTVTMVVEKEIENPATAKLAEIKIAAFQFGSRIRNAFIHEGIFSAKELCEKTARDLLEFNNFGEVSLRQVRKELAEHNLHLRGEGPENLQ